jgi:D-arabinose 1-dehydrogenase-like Zn-dependent alcohol dehydrogenase
MSTMRAVQVTHAKGPLVLVQRPIPEPGPGAVRIKIQACGVCHSDSVAKEGLFPNIQYPRVPGHEIAGVIDKLGAGVVGWTIGDRVGVGWHGGHCGYCDSCRRGSFVTCQTTPLICGVSYDGGYAEYTVVPSGALALIPPALSPAEAGPLMCAGVTTFNSLRNSGARPGDLVAILGVGGLGHLGVQFAAKMGFKTVAIARGPDKAPLAKKLGAHEYIDSQKTDPAARLSELGGAKIVLATATNGAAMTATIGGLSVDGKLIVLGAPFEPVSISFLDLIMKRRSIVGWPSGSSIDSQDTMSFSALTGVRSMNEIYPLERAPEAYERMMSGKASFRVVLTMT